MIRLEQIKAVEKGSEADAPKDFGWYMQAGVTITANVECGPYKCVKDGPKWMKDAKGLEARKKVLRYIYGDLLEPLNRLFADLKDIGENGVTFAHEESVADTIDEIKRLLAEVEP